MTEPSQYFKGRTVQEQMNEVIGYVDTRSAEVATDAIAADVAQVHQDMLDADADAAAAAASAAAAAGTLANAVKKTGEASQSIAGDIAVSGDLSAGGDLAVTGDISGGTVTVPTPVNNTDAANKKYVDDADALKADKTYVDAQDALKINITDINSYAVGLTGNQNPIAGTKTFTSAIAGVCVGYRVKGQLEQNKWYEIAKIPQTGRRNYGVKVTFASATFDSFLQIEGITGGNAFLCRRLGNISTSTYPTANIAIGVDSSSNKCILVKGYDNRWFTTVEIGEEYRGGDVMLATAGDMSPLDDLSSYNNVVYGSDMS